MLCLKGKKIIREKLGMTFTCERLIKSTQQENQFMIMKILEHRIKIMAALQQTLTEIVSSRYQIYYYTIHLLFSKLFLQSLTNEKEF